MTSPELSTDRREWLEPDSLGGFASGTVSLVRTRRYHALLLAALRPPAERRVLVNGYEAWVTTPRGRFALSSQRYEPGVTHPDGASRLRWFKTEPWPHWVFECEDGTRIAHEIFARHGVSLTAVSWKLLSEGPATLEVRPLLSGRDPHELHHENGAFDFAAASHPRGVVSWRPYAEGPETLALASGTYEHAPLWYRKFLYEVEIARGLEGLEDLASPGVFRFDLAAGEAAWLLAAATDETRELLNGGAADSSPDTGRPEAAAPGAHALEVLARLRAAEKRRRRAGGALDRAADAYIVRRGRGRSIVAGYPWFGEWGRDTFIALRGLCLATGRIEDARRILIQWSGAITDGLMPNRFPDHGTTPEYDSVDAALWFVVAVHDFFEVAGTGGKRVSAADRLRLRAAVAGILESYLRGTRFGIRADSDGLLVAGEGGPGVSTSLTWMDARVAGRAVTPRIGKPVEVQALWINALLIGAAISARWSEPARRARDAFEQRFWNSDRARLYDVVDAGGVRGANDDSMRPNQLFAIGGLPFASIKGERARRVVDACEAELWTAAGPRTLAPGEPGYAPRYAGGPAERDAAYHQGTVWPWLAGAFIEAWVRVRSGSHTARREARERFFTPLIARLGEPGLGHLPELADAEPPHASGGCPFQAWSLGEALRIDRLVLADGGGAQARTRRVVGTRTRRVSGRGEG